MVASKFDEKQGMKSDVAINCHHDIYPQTQ